MTLTLAGCVQDPSATIEVFAYGEEVRRLSHRLGSFCPRLDRDLADLGVHDGGQPQQAGSLRAGIRRATLLPERGSIGPYLLRQAYPGAAVLLFSGTLGSASEIWDPGLPAGRLFCLGGRSYSRAQRDQIRGRQRLLPLSEVALGVAAHTAALETGQAPIWVVVELDILATGWETGELPTAAPGGTSLEALREALEAVPGQRVVGFEVVGCSAQSQGNSSLALTGAELLRDNILTWWHNES